MVNKRLGLQDTFVNSTIYSCRRVPLLFQCAFEGIATKWQNLATVFIHKYNFIRIRRSYCQNTYKVHHLRILRDVGFPSSTTRTSTFICCFCLTVQKLFPPDLILLTTIKRSDHQVLLLVLVSFISNIKTNSCWINSSNHKHKPS